MANLTVNKFWSYKPREGRRSVPIANGETLYAGSLVKLASGYATKWNGTGDFLGIMVDGDQDKETLSFVGNTTVASPPQARVDSSGLTIDEVDLTGSSVTQASVGAEVYCGTDNIQDATTTASGTAIGVIVRVRNGGASCAVELYPPDMVRSGAGGAPASLEEPLGLTQGLTVETGAGLTTEVRNSDGDVYVGRNLDLRADGSGSAHAIRLGASQDFRMWHSGTLSQAISYTGNLDLRANQAGTDVVLRAGGSTQVLIGDGSTSGVQIPNGLLVADKGLAVNTDGLTSALTVDNTTGRTYAAGPMRVGSYSTAQRDLLTPAAGDIIFNTTDNEHQGYDGSMWNGLYGSTSSSSGGNAWDPDPTDGPIVSLATYVTPNTQGQTANWDTALAAASGGRLVIPPGIWFLEKRRYNLTLQIPADTTIEIQEGATVQAEYDPVSPDRTDNRCLFYMASDNCHIRGRGTIIGDLRSSTGSQTGEQRHNIWVAAATNWSIIGITTRDAFGDGIRVGGTGTAGVGTIDWVVSDNNRRQGLSITDSGANLITVGDNCQFINTGRYVQTQGWTRQYPTAGIDVEPNSGTSATNVVIGSVLLDNNVGDGITVQSPFGDNTAIATINGATATNNGIVGGPTETPLRRTGHGFDVKEGAEMTLNNCIADNNANSGVKVFGAAGSRTFQGQLFMDGLRCNDNGYAGVEVWNTDAGALASTITNVTFSGNGQGDVPGWVNVGDGPDPVVT